MSRFPFLKSILLMAGMAFFVGNIFSQTGSDLWGFDRGVLDYQFDRADRELSPGRWMEEARRGRDTALKLWEELIPQIADSSQGLEVMKELAEWSETELENRFTRWLLDRFFGTGLASFAGEVSGETLKANKMFIYMLGEDGRIIYDENTGDPVVIRPGTEGHEFEKDLSLWKDKILKTAGHEIALYEAHLASLYPELLSYVDPENRESFEKKLAAASEDAVLSLGKEFAGLLAREERYFTARRLGDVWSLRKKSEDESASAIGSRIIEETNSIVAEGLAALEERIEAADAGAGDLVLAGEEWLAEYRTQFERGLKAWADAEERFFTRRLEWELDAERYYLEGEKAWNNAYESLEAERKKWEANAKVLFESGEALFVKASENLERSISEAKLEFEKEAGLRVEAAARQAGAWADMYITCGSITAEARANIDFWLERYTKELKTTIQTPGGDKIPAFTDGEFGNWLNGELSFHKDNETKETELLVMILGELENWKGIYESYYAKALEARDALANEFTFVMGAGTLIDILNQGVSTEDFNLDEYQLELIRARAASVYWAKKTAIAEKVLEYAEELTAGRITDSEGIAAWEAARKAYDDSLLLYKEAEERLSLAGAATAEARLALSETSVRLQEADMVLRELKQIYTKFVSVYDLQEDSFILAEIKSRYQELSDEENILDPSRPESVWLSLYNIAVELWSLEETGKGWELLEEFVTGNQAGKTLAELHDTFLEINTLDDLKVFPEDIEAFALREDAPCFSLIRELMDQMKNRVTEAGSEEDRQLVSRNYETLIGALVSMAKEEAKIEFENRLAAISFLIDQSSDQSSIDQSGQYGQSGEENLEVRAESARLDLLKARISLELEALEHYLEGKPAGGDAETLAWFCSLEDADAYRFKEVLEELDDLFNQNGDKEFEELEALLSAAADESEEKYFFLNGGSFISPYAGVTESFLGSLNAEAQRSAGLLGIYMNSEFVVTGVADPDSLAKRFVESLEDTFEMISPGTEEEFESWKDGLLGMLLEEAETGEIQGRIQGRLDDFRSESLKYLDNPLLEWQGMAEIPDIQSVNDEYSFLVMNIQNHLYGREFLKKEIEKLEQSAELLSVGLPELRKEMEAVSSEISLKQSEYDDLIKLYEGRIKNLDSSGEYYDLLYGEVKERYQAMEEAAFVYETQDAIRRWASTAYLDSDLQKEELLYAREKFERSQAVLDVLVDLFNHGETRRSYENEEYEILFNEYKESFSRKMLSQKVYDLIEDALFRESEKNRIDYDAYISRLNTMSGIMNIDSTYVSPENKGLWTIIDVIRVEDGRLQFSYDDLYVLHGSESMADLADYAAAAGINGVETNYVSSFELAVRELSARLSSYGLSMAKYQQLALARDYLIRTIVQNNPGITSLSSWYHDAAGLVGKNSNLGQLPIMPSSPFAYDKVYEVAESVHAIMPQIQLNAWNSLSESERKDLEFYTILTFLQGGGENSEYFSLISEYIEVYPVYEIANSFYRLMKHLRNMPVVGFIYKNKYNTAKYTRDSLAVVFSYLGYYVNAGYGGLITGIDSLDQTLAAYLESSEHMNILYGGGNSTDWDAVEKALNFAGGLDSGELLKLEEYWNQMAGQIDLSAVALPDAVKLFAQWSAEAKEESRLNLEAFWNENHGEFAEAENDYYLVYQEYLNGTASIDQVTLAAERAYGKEFPARKNHTENLAGSVMADLFGFIERGKNRDAEYNSLAAEYVDIISRAYGERYMAEMAGREVEWEERRHDITEKYREWQNSAVLMIEKGRADWEQMAEKLQGAYVRWVNAYRDEYQRTDEAWAAAYLEGLKDKETWAAQATRAANEASSGALLALIGSDAESMARAMDTRNPVGIMNTGGIEEAAITLRQLLETTGLNNLNAAFGALNGSSGTLITNVRQGTGGPDGRNYGTLAAEASRLAKSATEELTARESKRIALHVKDLTAEALKLLSGNVQKANSGFRKQMDETFILEGQWQKSGIFYVKDVLVHSTLFTSIITDEASLAEYRDYLMPVLYLNTDLSEERLKNLDSWAVDSLIKKMYAEVEEHAGKIFGSGTNGETGEFGMHLGRQPVIKPNPDVDKGRSGVFNDYGAGEIGRLMTEFNYWKFKESYGIAALSQPPWNKPLWDSRGSWFQAPSIRSIADMGLRIAGTVIGAVAAPITGGGSLIGAIALNAAVNTADDLIFDLMDVSVGAKSWGEAGFSFGKSLLMNTASSATSAVFSGIGGPSSGFFGKGGLTNYMASLTDSGIGGTIIGATMKGLEAFTTGSLTSIIGAVTYDDENGWDFSREQLAAGFSNSWKTGLSSSAGSFTTGLLDLSMEGFTGKLYSNGRRLDSLMGSLTSQGISYATGGDFTLNLLSTSLFTDLFSDKNKPGVGLLEFHLGREGVQMGLGTGGADVSIGTLISAAKGFEAWKVNSELLFSGQEAAGNYASQLRTLYSMDGIYREEYGNYIAGKTKIAESGDQATESVYDPVTGIKTVHLGSSALNDQSRFGLNVVLSHEANRDGITGDETEQDAETQRAVLGHMATALELLKTYNSGLGMDMTIEALLFNAAQRSGDFSIVNAIAGTYDSSADYWLLLNNGSFAYDGNASLRDMDGNIIRSAESMGLKETQIEGALIRILGLDPTDSKSVSLVRNMMVEAGIKHSYSDDPEQWYWGGKHAVEIDNSDGLSELLTVDLSVLNLGWTITLDSIANLYASIGADQTIINNFLNKNYGSAVDFLNYVFYGGYDDSGAGTAANKIIMRAYNFDDAAKIVQNVLWYNKAMKNGINIRDMISGDVNRTQDFGENSGVLTLATSSVPGAKKYMEEHTGIDYGSGGSTISVPGGYWEFFERNDHRAYYQLYGGSLKMRIMHVNPDELKTIQLNTIFGGENTKLLNYPTQSYGSGTGAHIHIDMTMRLPYNGYYTRQFVNPEALRPGNQFNYRFSYMDAQGKNLANYPANFNRY
jgi:hypothetical protein